MSKIKERSPNQKYLEMGLEVHDRLIFELLPDEEVRIDSNTGLFVVGAPHCADATEKESWAENWAR